LTSQAAWLCPTLVTAAPPNAYGKIELVRDRMGTPHVFSETDAGAMYGLGYATAQERAFQMYYNLRIIQGRVAELLGDRPGRGKESTVDHDRKMRAFGFYRAARTVARNLDADSIAMLTAYSEGVNDYVAAHGNQLHPLFAELGLRPEPWSPADCIASWWHLGQFFATDGTRELIQYRNLTQPPGGREAPKGRDGRPLVPPTPSPQWYDDEAAVVGRGDVSDEWAERVNAFAREHGLLPSAAPPAAPAGPRFSHAWVVGGKRTTTGSAVLVSDPQTIVWAPSLWHEFHVCGKTFNARGVGVPGCPGLLIGWNEQVAWGATALGADQADLFRLKTDAEHPNQYLLDGRWKDMETIRETIEVKGGRPVELVIRQTVFGPVVTPFAFPVPGDPEVALRRVPVCQTDRETIQALLGMMRARDMEGFTRATAAWQFPSLNLVFGDRRGNIGYWLLAAVPIRSRFDTHRGTAAGDGTRSDADWQGFVPHDLLPHVINPSRGWIASANHRPIGSFYPVSMGLSTGSMGHTIRSWRLYERLGTRERFAPEDVLDVHYDAVNPARRDIVRVGLHLRDALHRELSPEAADALKQLEGWLARGAKSDLNEPGSALAGEIPTMFRFLTTPLASRFGGGESGLTRCLRDLQGRIANDPKTDIDRPTQDFIDQSLAAAWRSARQRYGDDPARWNETARAQVGQRPIEYFGTLDGFGSLDRQANLKLPPLDCVDAGTIRSQAAQSYTQYIPLDDVDAAMSLLPPGHGERADDPLRQSSLDTWKGGRLCPAPLSRAAVDTIAAKVEVLSQTTAVETPNRVTLENDSVKR
jgi:penicillin amidase